MLTGNDIVELVELLNQRQASLFHACQLRDYLNYLKLGGIPSHDLLEQKGLIYTPLDTDDNDRENDVWGKVFVNLSDFGRAFAQGSAWTPNAFGPIAIQLRPEALLEAVDVAICLRSAGAKGFCRNAEALSTVDEVDTLFRHPVTVGFPGSADVKTRTQLNREMEAASNPEISLTMAEGMIALNYATVVIVDPYTIDNTRLIDTVRRITAENQFELSIAERACQSDRHPLYTEMACLIREGNRSLAAWIKRPKSSPELEAWGKAIFGGGSDWQQRRYAQYLAEGTLSELGSGS